MENKRIREIKLDIMYNNTYGIHTFTMCECGRQGSRVEKCNLCLREEWNKLK